MKTGQTKVIIALIVLALCLTAAWFYGCGKTDIVAPPLETTTTTGLTTTTAATTTTTTSGSTSSTGTATTTTTSTTTTTAVSFFYETVDSANGAMPLSSRALVIDNSGKAHLCYNKTDVSTGHLVLMYANNSSGSWAKTQVDSNSGADVGQYASIARDTGGFIHISYMDPGYSNFLKYATNRSGAWVKATVEATGGVGFYSSLALDSADKAHIAYYDVANKNLKYATNEAGPWVPAVADNTSQTGRCCSIDLDSSGNPHISYQLDTLTPALKYAYHNGISWAKTSIDSSSTNIGKGTAISIDHADKGHISYYDTANSLLKYATNSSGGWTTETVDSVTVTSGGTGEQFTSIDTDGNNKPHIAYYDSTAKVLKYARKTGGSWEIYTVDSAGDVGRCSSITVDSNNKPHFCYYDATNAATKYAKQN